MTSEIDARVKAGNGGAALCRRTVTDARDLTRPATRGRMLTLMNGRIQANMPSRALVRSSEQPDTSREYRRRLHRHLLADKPACVGLRAFWRHAR